MTAQAEFTAMPIYEAIARAKAECGPVGKDGWNEQQRFKFRGVDAVVNGAARALNRYGVVITTKIKLKQIEKRTYQSKNGANMLHVLVPVRFELYGADGTGPVVVEVVGEAADTGDKVVSKATSVAYRIMLIQTLNLPTGDPDPDLEVHERDQGAASGGDPWQQGRGQRRQRRENGSRAPRPPGQMRARPPLDGTDPWKAKVEELSSAGDARAAEEELEELWKGGQVDDDRANQVLYAIRQRFPRDAQEAAANGNGQAPAQPPENPPPPQREGTQAAGDPVMREWAARIDGITDFVTALKLNEQLTSLEENGGVDPGRAKVIRDAIEAKRASLPQPKPEAGRPKGPPAEERGAVAVPTGKGDDGEWVRGWLDRAAAADVPARLVTLQAEIGNAVRAKTITPAKSAELSKVIQQRRRELEGAPA